MKKTLIKTAMMAVIAMTLLAGIAIADTIEPWEAHFYGEAGGGLYTGGARPGAIGEDITTAWEARLYTTEQFPFEFVYGTGWFESLSGAIPTNNLSILFRGDNAVLWDDEAAGYGYFNVNENFGGVNFGTIDGIEFYAKEIVSVDFYIGTNGYEPSLNIALNGWVDNGVMTLGAEYSIQIARVYGKGYEVYLGVYTDTPPTVPEPGTLVLLGTGLLGAALVARRKIQK